VPAQDPITSLWLVPAEPHRAELRSVIDALAVAQRTPAFEPHVTLASGPGVDPDALVAAVERVAAELAPLELVAGPTTHGPERFRCVVVELADRRLHDVAAIAAGALGLPFDAAAYRPHLSLLYAADLAAGARARIAAAHDLTGRTVRFDTIVASRPGNGIDDVARWQLDVVRPMTGPA
jgi:2'-5' RNA ligase